MESTLLLSTIVVSRDNPAELQLTLVSIASQWPVFAVEVIVVDSSAELSPTAELQEILGDRLCLKHLQDRPARGVYPAMNLGLQASRGQIVHFLNAGDSWFDPTAQAAALQVWQAAPTTPRALVGQALICPLPPCRTRPWLVPDPAVHSFQRWLRHYVPNHQSLLVDGDWARRHPLATDAPHSADRDWMRLALADLTRVVYLPRPLVRFQLGGISSRLPDWPTLLLRLREPSRSSVQKLAEVVKFLLRPLERHYPALMALRSRCIGWLV
jgi:putative colanic acid biosynthesis glycosyltransferase